VTINFLDLETTDLDPHKGQVWEVGMIRRRHGDDTEFLWQFAVDLDRANPRSLEVGQFHDRFVVPAGWEAARLDPATGQVMQRLTLAEALFDFQGLWEWEDDRPTTHMVGAVPSFDDGYLKVLFAKQQRRVCWHYHLVCVENLAAGCLGLEPPWDSEALSRAMGVDPGRYLRHSAIGDCRGARDLYDAVMARRMPGPIPADRPHPDENPEHAVLNQLAEHEELRTYPDQFTITTSGGSATITVDGDQWTWRCWGSESCPGEVSYRHLTSSAAEADARGHLREHAQQEVRSDG
jgi:hypothetical protein